MRLRLGLLLVVMIATTPLFAAEPKSGSLAGRFVYDGDPPKPVEYEIAKDRVGAGTKVVDESLVVDKATGGLRNVIVTLFLKPGEKPPAAVYVDGKEPPQARRTLLSALPRFDPHVLAVRTGQTLEIFNPQLEPQNAKFDFAQNDAVNLLVKGLGSAEIDPVHPERLPVRFSDTIHPWKIGYLVVTNHPFVAISDAQGNFKIDHLPPGEWTFRVWQEKTGFVEEVTLAGKPVKWSKGQMTVVIKEGENDLGEVVISETAWR